VIVEDLVRWLSAQLDEDERVARGCSGMAWQEHPKNWVSAASLSRVALVVHDGDRSHVVRHDPARVLRETDAKRRLLELHALEYRDRPERVLGEADDPFCAECSGEAFPCETLRLLALPYADRPGYREEWAP
jgi:hypothetical protein